MKFLIIQENGRHEKNRIFRECFCIQRALFFLGHESDIFGKGHEAKDIDFNNYDIIINLENYDKDDWVPDLSGTKAKKFLWSIDAHVRGPESYEKEFKRGKYDCLLHSTLDFCSEKYHVWFPNCFDDFLCKNLNIEKKYDVGFCGNIMNRVKLISLLQNTIKNFKLDEFVIGHDMVNAVCGYQIHFNCNIANDINYRSFETIGCGTLLLTNYNHQYEKLGFIDFHNCIFYYSSFDLLNKINILLNDRKLLKFISNNGLELSKLHTYKERMKSLINLIK